MTEPELASILKCIDVAIDVYRNHKGALSAPEISVKSMLLVLRTQVADLLARERSAVE